LLVSEPAIGVSGARVHLGQQLVLDEVSVVVARGEVVALLGANGSGKSTLVRAALGLVPTTSGTVALLGTPLGQFRAWERIGYVPQRVSATGGVPATVGEVVGSGRLTGRTWWRRTSPDDRAQIQHAMDAVGLGDLAGRSVNDLSGGQQQRVLIARALVRQPQVLFLDEPTAGVDRASQDAFAEALRQLVHRGTTVVLVLHELGVLGDLVQRAVVLRAGRVVHDGTPPPARPMHAGPDHDHVHPHAFDRRSSRELLP
jgi:zinc transport system ATP-binding protein